MGARISELVLEAGDAEALADFWCAVLGFVVIGRESDGSVEIGPPDVGFGGLQPTIVISRATEPPARRGRLHIDLSPVAATQQEELERLRSLGAVPADVGQTGEESWHVLADPEGNVFCLLRRAIG